MAEKVGKTADQPPCQSRRHDRDDAPSRTSPGSRICAACREQTEEDLVELPGLYEMCAYMLDLRDPLPRERVGGHRPKGIVLRDAVVTVRTDILGVLASWCGLITSERGVTGPDEPSIRRLTTFMLIHFTWLTAHPAASDFADELNHLAESARSVLTPPAEAVLDLGPCARHGCGRTVRTDGHPPTRARCDAGHEWAPEQWLLLRGKQYGFPNGHPGGHGNGNRNAGPHDERRADPRRKGTE